MQSKDEIYLDPQQAGGYFARVFDASDAGERICTHADPHAMAGGKLCYLDFGTYSILNEFI